MQGAFQVRPGKLAIGFLLMTSLLTGCARLRPATSPLHTVSHPGSGSPRTLVVLLPGRRDSPADFRKADFPELAARAGAAVDMVAVDAHMGYYFRRTIVDRLHEDVIAPARKKYDRIWLVGVSVGGTGSLLYAAQHPENVDGILLLAPFLGEEEMIREVEAAGGLRGWKAPGTLDPQDFQRRLWAWLDRYEGEAEGKIPLYLGYGTRDSFARANGILARELPEDRVFTVEGGHDWKAWRALWERFVSTGALRDR
jgi:pimeloyl-ACP methyl ester carboxylesterase